MIAIEYLLNPADPQDIHLYLRRMAQSNGPDLWAIYRADRIVWNRQRQVFSYDPLPSSRTEAHLRETRFTWDEAQAEAELALTERRGWLAMVTGGGA